MEIDTGFKTHDIGFTSVLCHVYSFDALTKIDFNERNRPEFTFDIDTKEAADLWKDFESGQLHLLDIKHLFRTYSRITKVMKDTQRNGDTVWTSPSWIRGERG